MGSFASQDFNTIWSLITDIIKSKQRHFQCFKSYLGKTDFWQYVRYRRNKWDNEKNLKYSQSRKRVKKLFNRFTWSCGNTGKKQDRKTEEVEKVVDLFVPTKKTKVSSQEYGVI